MNPIVTRLKSRPNLQDYGIQVPLLKQRADQIEMSLRSLDLIDAKNFKILSPDRISIFDLALAHSDSYIRDLFSNKIEDIIKEGYELIDKDGQFKRFDPDTAKFELGGLFDGHIQEASGVYESALLALDRRFCYFLGGGMHHAKKSSPGGFCLISDIVISIRKLQKQGHINTAWVIDTDVHKGDGTAELCLDDKSIQTLSIHMADGWPLDATGPKNFGLAPWCNNNVDIGIKEGCEHAYLDELRSGLDQLLVQNDGGYPDFIICVNGSDPYEKDQLESSSALNLNLDALLKRDRMVFEFFKGRSPQLWLTAGGYGEDVYRVHSQFIESVLRK